MSIKYDKEYYKSWQEKYYKNRTKTLDCLKSFQGYYKRWFLIMKESSSDKFRNEIYQITINKFHEDLMKHKENKKISTLAKWLPRENSSLDKDLNFVENITKKMFPGLPPGQARQIYRKNIVELSKKIGVLENLMSQKKHSEINFKTIPDIAFKRNVKNFIKHPELMNKFVEEYNGRLIHKNSEKFLNELNDFGSRSIFEKGLIRGVFNYRKNEFFNRINRFKKVPRECVPVLDTSNRNIKNKRFKTQLLMCLFFASESNKIVINSDLEPLCLDFDWRVEYDRRLQEVNKNYQECSKINSNHILANLGPGSKIVVFSNNDTCIDYDESKLDKKLFIVTNRDIKKKIVKKNKECSDDKDPDGKQRKSKDSVKRDTRVKSIKKNIYFVIFSPLFTMIIVFIAIFFITKFYPKN